MAEAFRKRNEATDLLRQTKVYKDPLPWITMKCESLEPQGNFYLPTAISKGTMWEISG